MGTYTNYKLTVPPTFFSDIEGEDAAKVEEHIKALKELGVEVTPVPKVRNLPKGMFILGGLGTQNEEALEIGRYTFLQGPSKLEFYLPTAKFYEWAEVFKDVSSKLPGLFTLEGDSEEAGVHWRAYFKDGLYYQESASFPPFNESKLK